MSNLGLVFLLQLVRIVEIHDDTVHGQRLNCAGVERVHHAPDDVINITGRQVLSQRLQRGGGERRRVRIARTHFCDVVLPVRDCHFHRILYAQPRIYPSHFGGRLRLAGEGL